MKPRAALLAPVLALDLGCGRAGAPGGLGAEVALLERRTAGLESLVAAAEKGPLIPFQQVAVIVDQALVQEVLTAAAPVEATLQGKYRVRIDRVRVEFEDGFALVRLEGRASLRGQAEDVAAADVSVFCALDIVELDAASGLLRGRMKVVAFDARRVDVLGIRAPAQKLVEDLGREKLETFSALLQDVEIPVRLERQISLPGVGPGGEIRIAPATIPLTVGVVDARAYRGRLWISLSASAAAGNPPPSSKP